MNYDFAPRGDKTAWLVKNGIELIDLKNFLYHCDSLDVAVDRLWKQLKVHPGGPAHWIGQVKFPSGVITASVLPSKDQIRWFIHSDSREKRLFAVPDTLILELCPEVRTALEALA